MEETNYNRASLEMAATTNDTLETATPKEFILTAADPENDCGHFLI
jgi:hypothetical protein